MRAGLVQLVCVLAGLGLGLPHISAGPSAASTRVTEALVSTGFGTLGLVSVIFSLLFLVVQWAFSSLSPRLNLFRDDPIVWRTFAVAVGVFVFSVSTALVIGNRPKVSVIVPAVEVAAVLLTVALMRVLLVRALPPSSWPRRWRRSPQKVTASWTTSTAVPLRPSRPRQ